MDLAILSASVDAAQRHRPDDPDVLRAAARDLIALGLTLPDAAVSLGMTPRALADLLDHHPINPEKQPCEPQPPAP